MRRGQVSEARRIVAADVDAIEAVWRIESTRLLGGLVKMVRDVGLAEDLAQEALLVALEKWPTTGILEQPLAWLRTVARSRAIDEPPRDSGSWP